MYRLNSSNSWLRLMLSNALRRSMNHACTFPLSCFYICISCSITNACVVHEWYLRNPAWFGEMISLACVCSRSRSYSSLSITLVHTLVSDIGRCCAGSLGLCLSFGIRKMLALHISLGTSCSCHISCVSLVVIWKVTLWPYFSSSAVSLSGPGAFLIGRWSITYFIFHFPGGSVMVFSFSPISSSSW